MLKVDNIGIEIEHPFGTGRRALLSRRRALLSQRFSPAAGRFAALRPLPTPARGARRRVPYAAVPVSTRRPPGSHIPRPVARLPPRHDLPLEAICITIEKNLLEILRRAESRELRPVPLSGLPPSERHHRDRADGRSSTLSASLSEEVER